MWKKKRVEVLIGSQKGAMDKFIKRNELENIGECSFDEKDNNINID